MITVLLAASLLADGVQMTFVPSGATARTGGYRPVRAEFTSTKPANLKKAPDGLKNPMYGEMKFGAISVGFIIDDSKIYVDSNRDGDYTNDAAAEWGPKPVNGMNLFQGGANADIGRGTPVHINFYRFDPNDPNRAALKSTLLYYGDFGYEITLTLNGKQYKSFITGEPDKNTSLSVDRNGDGKNSFFFEAVKVGTPFNFTGTTYVLNAANGKLTLDKAPAIPESPMPPDLRPGHKALNFTATTMDGTKITFPDSYKGKVVLLDFWATWCGPCMAEVPNVVKAYEQLHDKGFEILGISFDQPNAVEKINSTTKDNRMTWKQVYEGKFWDTTIGHQWDIASIPAAFIIDGDTGEILAEGNEIRGAKLVPAIEKALAQKRDRK